MDEFHGFNYAGVEQDLPKKNSSLSKLKKVVKDELDKVNSGTKTTLGLTAMLLLLMGFSIGFVNSQNPAEVMMEINFENVGAVDENGNEKPFQRPGSVMAATDEAIVEKEDPIAGWQTYFNKQFNFSFKYPEDNFFVKVTKPVEDREFNPDAMERFEREAEKDSPEILHKIEVVPTGKEAGDSVLRVHVYKNSSDRNIDDWFEDYQYYPYEWGAETLANKLTEEIDKDGIIGKYAYTEGLNKFKFVYFENKQFVYLVWMKEAKTALEWHTFREIFNSLSFNIDKIKVFENPDYGYKFNVYRSSQHVESEENKLIVKKGDNEVQTFTIFDANKTDKDDMVNWWKSNIYSEVGGYDLDTGYDLSFTEDHPLYVSKKGINMPTLAVKPKIGEEKVISFYVFYDFGKPFVIHYVENISDKPSSKDLYWPLVTMRNIEEED